VDKSKFISRREAANILGVSNNVVTRVLEKNGVKVHRIPNHNRFWYLRKEIEQLVGDFNKPESANER
jgi:hypothetical protein